MRTLFRWTALFVVAALTAAVLTPVAAHAAPHVATLATLGHSALGVGFAGFAGALKFPVQGLDYGALFRNSNAPNAATPEAIPYEFYDTKDFASNWTSINFFGAVQADKTLSNIQQPNTLSAEQYFMLYAITCDFLMGSAQIDNAAPQQYNDARIIQDTARATLVFSIAMKEYLRIPLRACHSAGGVTGIIQGTPAAAALANTVQNFPCDGGYWMDGAVILPPKQTFEINVIGVAQALTATRSVQIGLHGVLFRPVR